MNYEQLAKVNSEIKTVDIKGKSYSEVSQRIQAFRKLYPNGCIQTELVSNDAVNNVHTCVIKASVYDEKQTLLGTGFAYEKENSTFINKTSYIENCETSAVGRALGMLGIGSDSSVCSAEEITNAVENQKNDKIKEETAKKQVSRAKTSVIEAKCKEAGLDTSKVLALYKHKSFSEFTEKQFEHFMENIDKLKASLGGN